MYLKDQISRFLPKALTFKVIKKHFTQSELEAEGYVSQCGQDKWGLESLFGHVRVGTLVGMGANDRVTISNRFRLIKLAGMRSLSNYSQLYTINLNPIVLTPLSMVASPPQRAYSKFWLRRNVEWTREGV